MFVDFVNYLRFWVSVCFRSINKWFNICSVCIDAYEFIFFLIKKRQFASDDELHAMQMVAHMRRM